MKRLLAALAGAALLAGCAYPTEAGFVKNMNSWVGSNFDEYAQLNGAPDGVYELSGGGKVYTVISRRAVHYSGSSITMPQTATLYGPGGQVSTVQYSQTTTTPDYTDNLVCEISFTVDSGNIIRSYSYQGNDCVAMEGPAD